MIELSPAQVTPQLTALFDRDGPASMRCFAVLTGRTKGKIITDDPLHPAWGMVWEAAFGTLYPGGTFDAATIQQIITMLRADGDVLIGFWDGDVLAELLPPSPQYVGTVLEFRDRPLDTTDLDGVIQRVPSGYTLRRMDPTLVERSLEYDVHQHGSTEAFLETRLVTCLLHDDSIVSEASSCQSIEGVRELGVNTREQYRGHGFATIACAYLIRLCAQAGDLTYWNCAATNVASASVARKLGYRTEKEYRLLAWFKSLE